MTGKTVGFALGAALLAYGLAELACFAGLQALRIVSPSYYALVSPFRLTEESREGLRHIIRREFRYVRPDPALGWAIVPNGAGGDLYRANSQGLRAERDFPHEAPPGKVRAALFGDSFTHGDDVTFRESWAHVLESGMEGLEVMNFGVGGYGLDQAYLRYEKEGRAFRPKVVVIGFVSDDIRRHVNVFRPFYSQPGSFVCTKPRFILRDGTLELLQSPLKETRDFQELLENEKVVLARIGRDDYYYQRYYRAAWSSATPLLRALKLAWNLAVDFLPGPVPIVKGSAVFNRESEAYRITLKLMEAFHERVVRDGAVPLVVLFPDPRDVTRARSGRKPVYQPLAEDLRAKGFDVLEVLDGFKQETDLNVKQLFGPGRHYNALGNRIAARAVAGKLRAMNAGGPPA